MKFFTNIKDMFQRHQSFFYWSLVSTTILLLIYIQYYGVFTYHYIVPPGDDPSNHFIMIRRLLNGYSALEIFRNGGYPPGFHLLVAEIARFSHTDILKILVWIYPSLIILASISIFIFCYTIFGRFAAYFAMLFYGFFGHSNIQLQNDGGYPNLIASAILLPIFLLFFNLSLTEEKRKKWIFISSAILLFFLIVFTHHISTFCLLGILFVSTPVLMIYFWITNKWSALKGLFFVLTFLAITIFGTFLFFKGSIFASARSLLDLMMTISTHYPFIIPKKDIDPDAIWKIAEYPARIGIIPVVTSAIALLVAPLFFIKKDPKKQACLIILILWATLLYFGSRKTYLSNPERLARDMIIPLSILGGIAIAFILNKIYQLSIIVLIAFLLPLFYLNYPYFATRIDEALAKNSMVRITNPDERAIAYLNTQPATAKILITGWNVYIDKILSNNQIDSYSDDLKAEDILNQYDFLYVIQKEPGWIPRTITLGMPLGLSAGPNVIRLAEFKDDSKVVEIYKINHSAPTKKNKSKNYKVISPKY